MRSVFEQMRNCLSSDPWMHASVKTPRCMHACMYSCIHDLSIINMLYAVKKNCHIKPLPPLPSRPRWPLWRDLTESSYFGFITNLHCIGYLPQCKDTYFNAVVSFFKKFFQVRKYVVCI